MRERNNPFTMYDDVDFRLRYRFRKQVILDILERFGRHISPITNRNRSIDALTQFLVTLRFFATGTFQNCIGDHINISQPTVCRIIKRVSFQLASLGRTEIKMPQGHEEIIRVCADFYTIRNFPHVVGALDCTHIRITSPGGENAELYRNRKGYFSLNVQAVCDSRLKVRHIIARWPGSVHDATIFNDSPLIVQLENGDYGRHNFLLGDSGYPCKAYLLTPVRNPRTPAEEAYNRAHITTRNTVERCFGVLKRRFPCLALGLRTKLETTMAIIVACAVLHNFAIDLGDVDDEEPEEYLEAIEGGENVVHNQQENTAVRMHIINTVFDQHNH